MRSEAAFWLAMALALYVADARADLYKCVGKDNKVSYQAEPCNDGDGEKRVKTPVGGGGGPAGNNGSLLKAGWDEGKSGPIVSNCIRSGIGQARRAYASAGGDPNKLSEAELTQALEAHCSCMMQRITTTMAYADFAANPIGPMQRVSTEAANGGQCKLDVSGVAH